MSMSLHLMSNKCSSSAVPGTHRRDPGHCETLGTRGKSPPEQAGIFFFGLHPIATCERSRTPAALLGFACSHGTGPALLVAIGESTDDLSYRP